MNDGGTMIEKMASNAESAATAVMDKLPDTVAKTLDVLSERLKAPAEMLLAEVARYVFAVGISELAVSFLCLVLFIATVFAFRKIWKWAEAEGSDDVKIWASIVSVGILLFSFIEGVCDLQDGLVHLLAPAGSAIVAILTGKGLP